MTWRDFLMALWPRQLLRARRLRSKAMDQAHSHALRIDGYGTPKPREWEKRFPRAAVAAMERERKRELVRALALVQHSLWIEADAAAARPCAPRALWSEVSR